MCCVYSIAISGSNVQLRVQCDGGRKNFKIFRHQGVVRQHGQVSSCLCHYRSSQSIMSIAVYHCPSLSIAVCHLHCLSLFIMFITVCHLHHCLSSPSLSIISITVYHLHHCLSICLCLMIYVFIPVLPGTYFNIEILHLSLDQQTKTLVDNQCAPNK